MAKKRLLMIGINDYPIGKHEKLNNTKIDIDRLKVTLRSYGYDDPVILTDSQATRDGIIGALNVLVKESDMEDHVVIVFAGHGILDPFSYKLDLIPYDYNDGEGHIIIDSGYKTGIITNIGRSLRERGDNYYISATGMQMVRIYQ